MDGKYGRQEPARPRTRDNGGILSAMWREPYRPLSDDPRTMGLFQFAPAQPMVPVSLSDQLAAASRYLRAGYGEPDAPVAAGPELRIVSMDREWERLVYEFAVHANRDYRRYAERLRPPWWARAIAWGVVVYCAVSR